MNYDNLPAALKGTGRFCLWHYQEREGRKTKVPCSPFGGSARTNDPSTFSDFETALEALHRRPDRFDGLGLGIFGSLVGVDIDHCIVDEQLSPMAQEIVKRLNSYTEISPSGQGLHILCTAPGLEFSPDRYLLKHTQLGLEIYPAPFTKRYLTLTGRRLNQADLESRTPELEDLLETYMLRPVPSAPVPDVTAVGKVDPLEQWDDENLLQKMFAARNGGESKALWEGRWQGKYPSQSEADLAFCSTLAFWTRKDAAQMDRLFRRSGLMRPKWDNKRGANTYGQNTLAQALAGCAAVWEPRGNSGSPDVPETAGVARALRFLRETDAAQHPRYRQDDIGNSFLLADYLKPFTRPLTGGKGAWLSYDGKRWAADRDRTAAVESAKDLSRAMARYASSLPEQLMQDWLNRAKLWAQQGQRFKFLKDAESVYPIDRSQLDRDPWLLNLNNGTLELKTMRFRDHDPEDLLSKLAPVDYDPEAVCERWEDFVLEVMEPKAEDCCGEAPAAVRLSKAAFLQRWMGCCLTGDTSAEAFLVLYGPTSRNGKGVLVGTVQQLLGDYALSVNPETLCAARVRDSRSPSEDIARLQGIRMASVAEIQQGARLDASLVKQLTGGDIINARYLGENSFDFRPQCKLLLHTNHLPTCTDLSVFESQRAMVLPFSRHFEPQEQDPTLKDTFREPENQSGILNWLLAGLDEYRRVKLQPPESVRAATREYRQDSDKVSRFMDECLEQNPQSCCKTSEIYAAYSQWCFDNGQHAESSRNLLRELEKRGLQAVRKRPPGCANAVSTFSGVALLPSLLN